MGKKNHNTSDKTCTSLQQAREKQEEEKRRENKEGRKSAEGPPWRHNPERALGEEATPEKRGEREALVEPYEATRKEPWERRPP